MYRTTFLPLDLSIYTTMQMLCKIATQIDQIFVDYEEY